MCHWRILSALVAQPDSALNYPPPRWPPVTGTVPRVRNFNELVALATKAATEWLVSARS